MKPMLKRIKNELYYIKDGKRIEGVHENIRGDISECGITDEERKAGIDIETLLMKEEA